MNFIFKIAWRNLWRNKRRTQLTMGAMIFASTMLVFALGYYDGILWNLINNATEKENGHICLAKAGYYSKPSLSETITQTSVAELTPKMPAGVKGMCPRINTFALLSCGTGSNNHTQPAQLIGIDFASELKNSRLADDIVTGSFLSGVSGEIVLGKSLARRIKARLGSEIILFSSAADGSIASELFAVRGIFDSGDSLRDSGSAFINIKQAQAVFVLENQLHSLRLFLKNPLEAEEIADQLAKAGDFEATSWKVMFPQVAELLGIWLNVQIFTTAIFYAALTLITFNTMYMAFLERMHEFAVMKAVGLNRVKVGGIILTESLMIATVSGVVGTLAGTTLNLILFFYPVNLGSWMGTIAWGGTTMQPVLYCVPSFLSAFLPLIAMILLGIAVSVIPNYRLYRLKPVEALREA